MHLRSVSIIGETWEGASLEEILHFGPAFVYEFWFSIVISSALT
jgi:hypothetical protein